MFLPLLSSSPGDTRVSYEVRRHSPTFCFQKPEEKHCRSQPMPLPSLYFPNIQEGEEEARNLRNGPHCFMSLPEMAPHPVLRSLSQEAHAVRWISLCTDTAASCLTHTEALLPPSYSSALVMASNHIQESLLAGMAAGSFDGLLPGEALSTWEVQRAALPHSPCVSLYMGVC